ncbi:response regulator transcription factor [Limnobacter humi]|uniref:Response regulator transcription factor n=1 Tax=Limnobacter humi TaxID=1778671 RepID=A0ABT1WGK5_9BURK|nr:response regulator transcription factor [Limnobacter humi]MCQ8896644.1 response regulator transcription factor [Limnobacter humi]
MPIESTILLVDDHAAVRSGYRRFIEMDPDLRVIYEAGNAEQALAWLSQHPVDVAVMDISMPGQSGLELVKRVKLKWPDLPVVILSMHDSPVVASKALESGAIGYVTKSSEPEELVKAIRHALTGRRHVSSDVQLDSSLLSPREVDIVRLLVEGHTIDQAALSLGISAKTVSNNLSTIRQKVGVQTDFELAFWAWSQGLGKAPPGFSAGSSGSDTTRSTKPSDR